MDRHGRAPEIEFVCNAHRKGIGCIPHDEFEWVDVCMPCAIYVRQQVVDEIVIRAGRCIDTRQGRRSRITITGTLKRCSRTLQKQPFLRVHPLGLPGRVFKEPGIEQLLALEHDRAFYISGIIDHVLRNPTRAQLVIPVYVHPFDTTADIEPEFIEIIRTRVSTSQADDRNFQSSKF